MCHLILWFTKFCWTQGSDTIILSGAEFIYSGCKNELAIRKESGREGEWELVRLELIVHCSTRIKALLGGSGEQRQRVFDGRTGCVSRCVWWCGVEWEGRWLSESCCCWKTRLRGCGLGIPRGESGEYFQDVAGAWRSSSTSHTERKKTTRRALNRSKWELRDRRSTTLPLGWKGGVVKSHSGTPA